MTDHRATNRALVRFILLPTIFLTVALLGGLRVSAEGARTFIFIPPPLITLVLAVLLMALFVRGRLIDLGRWLAGDHPPLTNAAHALMLAALFFASAQAFNSVLPESGLLRWMLSFFFLWTLWNNQFATFDARRLLRSLAALFFTAFVFKHILLASLYADGAGWLRRLASALIESATLSVEGAERLAPASGYISFFTLALYTAGLALLPSAPEAEGARGSVEQHALLRTYRELPGPERAAVRESLLAEVETEDAARGARAGGKELIGGGEGVSVEEDDVSEETVIVPKK